MADAGVIPLPSRLHVCVAGEPPVQVLAPHALAVLLAGGAYAAAGAEPRSGRGGSHHLSCFGHLEERGQGQCAGGASQEEAKAAFEPGESAAIGFSDTPVVGVGLLTGFFSVGVGLQRASSCPA